MAVYGTIVCLGDSLTHGARDDYGRCYPMELSDMLWNVFGQRWVCAEEGVNGETSSDVLRRCVSVFKRYPEAFETIILCGTNDSKDKANIDPDVYRKNILGIIRMAAVYDKEVLLCTLPDLVGFGAPDYSQNSQNRIDEFNKVILELYQSESNIKGLIDLRGIDAKHYADGVHFKNSGHIEIARRIYDGLIEKRNLVRNELRKTDLKNLFKGEG